MLVDTWHALIELQSHAKNMQSNWSVCVCVFSRKVKVKVKQGFLNMMEGGWV